MINDGEGSDDWVMALNAAEAQRVLRPRPEVRVDLITGDVAKGEKRAMTGRLRKGPGLSE